MDKDVLNSESDTESDSESDSESKITGYITRRRTSYVLSLKSEGTIEHTSECKESFIDNLECINKCNCSEIVIVEDDYTDYEIINESRCIPIKNRYRKQTWYEYFRKLYMVSVILIISIIVYFYYSYGNRKDNVVNKL